jgi:FkbM family methyltransferase
MNPITKVIHKIVLRAGGEELFVVLRRRTAAFRKFLPVGVRHKFSSFGKFIPHSSEYPKDDSYVLTRDKTTFRINRSDYVQWRLFYGVRDNALREAKKYVLHGSIVLDIGASFGAFSLKLASHIEENKLADIQIHAFEPNPEVFESYKNNLKLNSTLGKMIRLHPFGLGDRNELRAFSFDNSNTGAGRVVKESPGSLQVKLQKMDDFIAVLNPNKIAFIKLIAEGFEPAVLSGGWRTIEKFRPPIFFEVTRSWWAEHGASVEDVLTSLKNLGYHFIIEHFNEMLPYEPAKYSTRTQFNIMAIPSE